MGPSAKEEKRRVKVKLSLSTRRRHIGGEEVERHLFLTWTLDDGEWTISRPPPLYPPGKEPVYPLNKKLGSKG